jgi:hypothetical protein
LEVKFVWSGFRQAIYHPLLVSLADHQLAIPQIGKVLGDGNLRGVKNGLKVADTKRSLREQVEDT